jgi:arylsulfatase A-like enzyme
LPIIGGCVPNHEPEMKALLRMKKLVLSITIIFFALLSINAQKGGEKSKRPNIILILADDLGYSDIGCYGGEIATPNLDYLANNGLRFNRFYNTSRCCPTRASLLTGIYNHNAGIGEMTTDRELPGYRGFISKNTVTIAEVLKDAGYHTAMVGKWHVSNTIEQKDAEAQLRWLNHKEEHPLFSPIEQYPVNRGFEKYYGNLWGVVDYFDPFSLVNGTTPVTTVPDNYYHTDAISDTAVAYIKEYAKEDKPFFLYLAETAPHWPLHALPEDIKKYADTYKVGWDTIREARYKKMIKLGLIDSVKSPLSPRWSADLRWQDNPNKEWDARAMAVHAAMIDRMDQGIGRILKTLKETGELDNTLILFLSDNGASPEIAAQYGMGFDRPGETRKGEKIAYPVKKDVLPGPETSFASIGPRWANVANTPYRFAKEDSYEGGVRTPFVAFWPKGITVPKGSICGRIGHVMDFMATFIELAGAKYPASFNGNVIKPLQGSSFLASFKNRSAKGHEALFNEHFGAKYARTDEWKLVARNKEPWHLYKIDEDETELNDLSEQHPEIVQRLDKLWQQWAVQNQVLPKTLGK